MLFFRTIGNGIDLRRVWVGITDRLEEGRWVWVDGTVATPSEIVWAVGQPDNANTHEHCAEVIPDLNYRMNDNSCRAQFQGLCEIDYEE